LADARTVVQAPPAAAAVLFGERLPLAVRYAEMLSGAAVERGLIGPGEKNRLWKRHLLNCAVVAELVPPGPDDSQCLADLGSGAGLPGIVLAIMLPAARVILVEPMARRTAFLLECAETLRLGNVEVRRGRAEDLAGQIQADVVTSRAVARLDRLAELAAGLAKPGGLVLAMKGASAAEELRQAERTLDGLGARDAEIVRAGAGLVDPPATVVRFRTGARASGPAGRSRPAGKKSCS
jgi:16S rRNA (guanine527-N7)-methyltransferase